jgi:hypothetical protein
LWFGRLRTHVTQRQRVIDRERLIDDAFDGAQGFIGKSLQP